MGPCSATTGPAVAEVDLHRSACFAFQFKQAGKQNTQGPSLDEEPSAARDSARVYAAASYVTSQVSRSIYCYFLKQRFEDLRRYCIKCDIPEVVLV